MGTIVTRRDYHLTRFKIERFLEKGFDNLSAAEEAELHALSKEMSKYEQVHFPVRDPKQTVKADKNQE